MEDISTLHSKLIGINCLASAEGAAVRTLWTQRFHERSAFWVDAGPGMSAGDIFERIRQAIIDQQIRSISGETCIVTVFLDCTQDIDPALLQALTELPRQLNTILGCHVALVYQFAYLGMMAPDGRKALRDRIMALSQVNARNHTTRRQICLVAQPPLAGASVEHWKATIVCLDLLRRKANLDDALPPVGTGGSNDDVGFLRYGEFDDERLKQLTGEKARLERSLSSNGSKEFREALCSAFRSLEARIMETIRPDGKSQPLHPGLFVEGWLKRKAAKKGTNKDFSEAQRLTQDAILATGKEITEQCLTLAKATAQDTHGLLRQLLRDSAVGIALESDRAEMRRLLDMGLLRVDIPSIPALRYSEEGYSEEIGQYFQDTLRRGIYLAKAHLSEGLTAAYNAITDESLSVRAAQYQQELDSVNHELKYTVQESDFCQSVRDSGGLLQACFAPRGGTIGGITRKHLLCRTKETAQRLTAAYGRPELSISLIAGTAAGLKTIDSAPVKALHILSFDCTPECLRDLITEVG